MKASIYRRGLSAKPKRGFTLLELIIAATILSILTLMATGSTYEKAAYGNYVFGAYMSAAGFPLSVTLAGANEIAFYHSLSNPSQYSGRQMDSFFWSLPAANVANITAGYNAQRSGTLCHK